MTAWSLDEHIQNGLVVVDKIHASPLFAKFRPRVCFHLVPFEMSDDEPWSEEASFCVRARPHFEALRDPLKVDFVGGTSGIEAFEYVMPSKNWLKKRVPELFDIAEKAEMRFDGWSFEPIEPRDATYFSSGPAIQVFNALSPEGIEAVEELQGEADEMDSAE